MDFRFLRNILIKALILFIASNIIFIAWHPTGLGRISIYNRLIPGRERLPFGENPTQSYNLSLFNLDAMFASHEIDGGNKSDDEYRVILIGDSSIWGTLLRPEETLAGIINTTGVTTCGMKVRAYNLGYPSISLTKDLLLLDYALRYNPDLIIWSVTLEAFPVDKQLSVPLVTNNTDRIRTILGKYDLSLNPNDPALVVPTIWDETIVGQRRSLADLFRLQMYGILWAATGVDQIYTQDFPPAQIDLENDPSFHGWNPPSLPNDSMSYEVLVAGMNGIGNIPIILVNEPMMISDGENSNVRYNFFYPRWVYDLYRQELADLSLTNNWIYYDLWDILPEAGNYTNSSIHLTAPGENTLAEIFSRMIMQQTCP